MLHLRGINLPLRQKELNEKVKEAIDEKIPFESLKNQMEGSDVDKLFKIDVASHYKNIDYMFEMFKSGDNLYISRALKSTWMFDDTYSNVINPNYLHDNIFPHMSMKMKKKLLSTISIHLRTEDRLKAFFEYCIGKKLTKIALKYLLYTSESFKLEVINEGKISFDFVNDESDYPKNFFGQSFHVLEAYLRPLGTQAWPLLYRLRDMYSYNNIDYLQLVEKYGKYECKMMQNILGLRMSKDIMTKHKERVLNNPLIYIPILKRKMIVKFSKVEDAKLFAVALLPKTAAIFWHDNFRWKNKYILDVIPKDELFDFLKMIFLDAYPGEEFEMCAHFYNYQFYDLLDKEKREKWAFKHLENQNEVLGEGQDFKWYSFVNFDAALEGIKKYIMKTPDKDRRSEILTILVQAAKTHRDLEKLFKYYYERHVNESSSNKEHFMNAIMTNHNVFEFDDDCWDAFNNILYSMEVYSKTGLFFITDFRIIVIIYCIVRDKEVPEQFKEVLCSGFTYLYVDKLSEEKRVVLYDYLINFFSEKLQEFEGMDYEGDVRKKIRQYVYLVLRVMEIFGKTKEECPDLVMTYVDLDWDDYKNHHIFKQKVEITLLEQDDLLRLLKEDATLLSDTFHDLKTTMYNSYSFRLNQLMRKLKVYFSNDVANEFFNFFICLLSEPDIVTLPIYTSVYCIFQLADDKFKIDFMCQYAPIEPKIDFHNIDRTLLHIREGICRFACYSRPPVPLEMILMYIKGDYVHFCLPMFGHYFVNLPHSQAMQFIESTLNSPISIQKHAIRLAFRSYSPEDLNKLITSVWQKTNNVSLRLILYEKLFQKVVNEDQESQMELYKSLKMFTSNLNDEDGNEIFLLITSGRIPEYLIEDFLVTAWGTVSLFGEKPSNLERQTLVLRSLKTNIKLIDRQFLMTNIVEPHVQEMLVEKLIRPSYKSREMSECVKTKWELTARFIVTFKTDEDIKANIELVKFIIESCSTMWDVVHGEIYTVRLFFKNFMSSLRANSNSNFNNFKDVNRVFNAVLHTALDILPFKEIYLTLWDLWLTILTRKVCGKFKYNKNGKFECVDDDACKDYAAEIKDLIKDLIKKKKFYKSFLPEITGLLKNHILVFSSAINRNFNFVLLLVCNNFAQYKTTEIHLLALMLLPRDCPNAFFNKSKDTLQKLKEIDNDEVQCFLYQKFVRDDFKRRKFL